MTAVACHRITTINLHRPEVAVGALLVLLSHSMFLEELVCLLVHEVPQGVLVDPVAELHTRFALMKVRLAVEAIMLSTFRASEMGIVSFHPNKYIITSC